MIKLIIDFILNTIIKVLGFENISKKDKNIIYTLILFIFISIFYLYQNDYAKGVITVLKYNSIFIFLFVISIGYSIWNYIYNKLIITFTELILQIITIIILLLITYMIFYKLETNLYENSIVNSKIDTIYYEEDWTEEYEENDCDSNNNCNRVTKTKNHSAKYYLKTSLGETVNIKKENYNNFSKMFNPIEKKQHRGGQTSSSKLNNEGDIWEIKPYYDIPVSTEISGVNYIKASKYTILNNNLEQNKNEYEKDLLNFKYPEIYDKGLGLFEFDRYIDLTEKIEKDLLKNFENKLDLISTKYWELHKINHIVIFTQNKNINFKFAIENKIKGFKKNDFVLIIDLNNDLKINWVETITLTDKTFFLSKLKNDILNVKNISDINNILDESFKILSEDEKGFKLKSMDDFEYLSSEIKLPLSYELFLIIFTIIFNFYITIYFKNNSLQKNSF